MNKQNVSVLNLDQFESDLVRLVAELRIDEKSYTDPEARQEAYIKTGKRLGFVD